MNPYALAVIIRAPDAESAWALLSDACDELVFVGTPRQVAESDVYDTPTIARALTAPIQAIARSTATEAQMRVGTWILTNLGLADDGSPASPDDIITTLAGSSVPEALDALAFKLRQSSETA
jgi:hypothetical protein